MKTTVLAIIIVVAVSAAAAFARPARIEMDFAKLLPDKWRVAHFGSDVTAPYSWEHDRTNVGISIRFEGPTKAEFHGTIRAEAVMVWIMPKEYEGKRLQGAPFAAAERLGHIGNHKFYANSVPRAKTWPSWRDDLKKKLNIMAPSQARDNAKE